MKILIILFLLILACIVTLIIINVKSLSETSHITNTYDYDKYDSDIINDGSNIINDYKNVTNDNKNIDNKDINNESINMNNGKEVYNVSENVYTYEDARNVCKALGSELATYEQLQKEFSKGADWCNYGWTEGQSIYYPTQKKTWDKLQENPTTMNMCGFPGINGRYVEDSKTKFGVNCYGIKPKKTNNNSDRINMIIPYEDTNVNKYEENKNDIKMLPFNSNNWSMYETTSRNFINDI